MSLELCLTVLEPGVELELELGLGLGLGEGVIVTVGRAASIGSGTAEPPDAAFSSDALPGLLVDEQAHATTATTTSTPTSAAIRRLQ